MLLSLDPTAELNVYKFDYVAVKAYVIVQFTEPNKEVTMHLASNRSQNYGSIWAH